MLLRILNGHDLLFVWFLCTVSWNIDISIARGGLITGEFGIIYHGYDFINNLKF